MMRATLLSWFDAGWSLDAAARVVSVHQRVRPEHAPEAHEAAAVRDEVHALVRGIMAECGLPAPVQRQTNAHGAPPPEVAAMNLPPPLQWAPEGATQPDTEGAGDVVGGSISSAPDAMRRLASIVMYPDGMRVTYNDLTGMAARLAELAESPGPAGDMWWLDAAVVKVLERGETGAEKARERWRKANAAMRCAWRYTRPLVEFPPELNTFGTPVTDLSAAMALVLDVALVRVRMRAEALEEARQREAAKALEEAARRGVAVVRPVAEGLMAMSPQQTLRGIEGPAPVAAVDGRVFGRIDANVAEHVHLLASVPGQRLVVWLAREGHRRLSQLEPEARLVRFESGSVDLRELFGGAKDTPWLDIIRAGAGFRFEHDRREFGALWTYDTPIDPADRRRKPIHMVIGTAILPGKVHELTDREARRLVPVLDFEPPVGGLDASKHAAVYRARYGLVVHMVDRAAAGEVKEHGGVLMDDQRWRRIASNAGLPWNDVDRMRGAWLDGDNEEAPPLIVRDGDVIRLAEPHAPQWAFIVEGGAWRVRSRANGKAAAKARQSDEVGAGRSKRGRK